MGDKQLTTLGNEIYSDITKNEYLNELYANILYNYSLKLFALNKERKAVAIADALRFADLLSKSPKDEHKVWAQEIVALLKETEPENIAVDVYLTSVLSNTGNYQGLDTMKMKTVPNLLPRDIFDGFYIEFSKELVSVPAEPDKTFFRPQKQIYDSLKELYLSYSGPTSMGKSFIMRMFIKKQVQDGVQMNFALIVPTKALINEVSSKVINELGSLLKDKNFRVVTSAGALVLDDGEQHNFIFVLTPERLLYLMIRYENLCLDYLFIDEAHKISISDRRSTFYYKDIDMLIQRAKTLHVIFSSPNIPNPEIYLSLIPDSFDIEKHGKKTLFSPVCQVKYLIDCVDCKTQLYNERSAELEYIDAAPPTQVFVNMLLAFGSKSQILVYFNNKDKAVQYAREYAANLKSKNDSELSALAKEIANQVHKQYYLAELITKGVAYHIGYLPATIRLQIEKLYRDRKITALFCTSTLVEGVNLPADNLFITTYSTSFPSL